MKVLLLKDVKNLGKSGEIKELKDGYAKNFIIAKGFGILANNEVLRKFKSQQIKLKEESNEKILELKDLDKKLRALCLKISKKVGDNGHLFGSVTKEEIAELLKKEHNIEINKKDIDFKDKIKELGLYDVNVKLGQGINSIIKLDIGAINV